MAGGGLAAGSLSCPDLDEMSVPLEAHLLDHQAAHAARGAKHQHSILTWWRRRCCRRLPCLAAVCATHVAAWLLLGNTVADQPDQGSCRR